MMPLGTLTTNAGEDVSATMLEEKNFQLERMPFHALTPAYTKHQSYCRSLDSYRRNF